MARKWIVREGSKTKGFRYKGPAGRAIGDRAQLERIDALRIPPAWRDVHISTDPRSAIQVWGFDARGRKQYKYHRRAVEKGELRKYYRVRQMARDLPSLRARIQRDFRRKGLSKEKVCAGIVRLISHGFFRVGSEKYQKENNTFGITTMRKSHVLVLDDTVEFEYRGKRSITQRNVVVGKDLARFVNRAARDAGAAAVPISGRREVAGCGFGRRQQLHREHRPVSVYRQGFQNLGWHAARGDGAG